ncbi:MAG: mannosyltransferase [Leptospiraceae bacterium]|nr:MAG: mannosyltransferase [Leptospiraceae bacterium]
MSHYIIAVDARPLSSPVSGVSRTISKIIENIKDDFEFHLFSHLPYHKDFEYLIKQENVIWNHSHSILTKKGGLWYILELPNILKKLNPDIFWGSQQTIPPFISKNIKTVLTIHDFVAIFYPKLMKKISLLQQRLLMNSSIIKADTIICNSKQTAHDLKKLFPNLKHQIYIINWGFDLPKNVKKNQLFPIQNYILAVSTIEPRKNYSTLLEAYYKYYLSETQDPYYLVIVGRRGWESKKFYKRLEELQEKIGTIIILDGIHDDQLYTLYENAAFFCMPSLYEGFGIPVLEALCFQKNVLISDIPCFHEIAEGYGTFLSPTDVEQWAIEIEKHVELHRKNQLPKIKFPYEQWSWKNIANRYKEVFNSLISS